MKKDFLTITPDSAEPGDVNVQLQCDANTSLQSRSTQVVFDSTGKQIQNTLDVTQEGLGIWIPYSGQYWYQNGSVNSPLGINKYIYNENKNTIDITFKRESLVFDILIYHIFLSFKEIDTTNMTFKWREGASSTFTDFPSEKITKGYSNTLKMYYIKFELGICNGDNPDYNIGRDGIDLKILLNGEDWYIIRETTYDSKYPYI